MKPVWYSKLTQKEKEELYICKKFEVGDVVHKTNRSSSKFEKKGIVVRVDRSQCLVHWETVKTPQYEFMSDLTILKHQEDTKNLTKKKRFMVMVFGRASLPIFYETYDEAHDEAQKLLFKYQQPAYVLELSSVLEFNDVKVTKIKKSKK